MTLLIADISSHNTILNWASFLGSVDGLICKVSEGTGYAWPGSANALNQARNAGKLVGVYHYAGPSGGALGDPVAEADYFLGHYTHRAGEVIVLDYEPAHEPADPDSWCAAWMQRVQQATGVVPMIYLNHFYASRPWTKVRALDAALWFAQYPINDGGFHPSTATFGPWPSYAMYQYTSNGARPGTTGPLDLSQFYGDANAWRAYGTPHGADMPLTQADADLVAATLLNKNLARVDDPSRTTNLAAFLMNWDAAKGDLLKAAAAAKLDPAAIAQAIVGQLPASDAQQVATLVLAGLNGARITTTPA